MSVGTILIGLAMLVLAIPLVAKPIIEKRQYDRPETEAAAERSYQDVLLALRDLELDHQMQVVSDEDYARLQGQLMIEAAQALGGEENEVMSALDERIETAVTALRHNHHQEQSAPACFGCGADLAADDKFCPQCGTAVLNCPQCQHVHSSDDKFCTACGTSLTTLAGVPT